jgi:hypothetical protein
MYCINVPAHVTVPTGSDSHSNHDAADEDQENTPELAPSNHARSIQNCGHSKHNLSEEESDTGLNQGLDDEEISNGDEVEDFELEDLVKSHKNGETVVKITRPLGTGR